MGWILTAQYQNYVSPVCSQGRLIWPKQPWLVKAGGDQGGGWSRVEGMSTEGIYRELRPKAIGGFVPGAP